MTFASDQRQTKKNGLFHEIHPHTPAHTGKMSNIVKKNRTVWIKDTSLPYTGKQYVCVSSLPCTEMCKSVKII